MTKKKDEKDNTKQKVLEPSQVKGIDWGEPDIYDFFTSPQEVRKLAIASFISWKWEHYRRYMWDEHRKVISQNSYATKTVGINAQLFSKKEYCLLTWRYNSV